MIIDVVDAIEKIAATEICEIQVLTEQPDTRLTEDVIDRLIKLMELVTAARKEQREQQRWLAKMPDDQFEKYEASKLR